MGQQRGPVRRGLLRLVVGGWFLGALVWSGAVVSGQGSPGGGTPPAAPGQLPSPGVPTLPPPGQLPEPSPPPRIVEPNPPIARPPLPGLPRLPLPGLPDLPGTGGSGSGSGSGSPGGGTPGSGAPGAGTPGSGTPGSGTPGAGAPRAGGRQKGPRQLPSRTDNKETIRALSVAGFLTSSVRYLRDVLGPLIIREMRGLSSAFMSLGYGLLALISLFTLWRLGAEQEDGSRLPAFMGRMVCCAVLIAISPFIVQTLFGVGYIWTASSSVRDMTGALALASPGGAFSMDGPAGGVVSGGPTDPNTITITTVDLVRLSAIDEWRLASKERFINGFETFRKSKLKVRLTNSKLFDPQKSGVEYFIPDFGTPGKEGFVRRFLVGLNPKNWSPLQLYSALEVSVLVMQIGIFTGWILLVFIMPLAELVAPVFFAVAVDKGKLFDQMTMPFIRGLLTASLIMPLVNIILEGIAYNIASLGFAVFNTESGQAGTDVFRWDAETERAVAQADPTVMVFTCCFLIAISGLSLILSPIIAYRIMSGELFGAAVGAISGWTAGLVSLGISAISHGVGASFQRQADHLSNVGNYQSSVASAAGAREAGHLRNKAEWLQALTQARAGNMQSIAGIKFPQPPFSMTTIMTKMTGMMTPIIAGRTNPQEYNQRIAEMAADRRGPLAPNTRSLERHMSSLGANTRSDVVNQISATATGVVLGTSLGRNLTPVSQFFSPPVIRGALEGLSMTSVPAYVTINSIMPSEKTKHNMQLAGALVEAPYNVPTNAPVGLGELTLGLPGGMPAGVPLGEQPAGRTGQPDTDASGDDAAVGRCVADARRLSGVRQRFSIEVGQ